MEELRGSPTSVYEEDEIITQTNVMSHPVMNHSAQRVTLVIYYFSYT